MRMRYIPIVHPHTAYCSPEQYPQSIFAMADEMRNLGVPVEYIDCERDGCLDANADWEVHDRPYRPHPFLVRLVEAWLFRAAVETGDPYWLTTPSDELVRRLAAICAGELTVNPLMRA